MHVATRTQIYLTEEQRARIDAVAAEHQLTMAEVIRRALDADLDGDDPITSTFGAAPGLGTRVPSRDEWDRG